MILILGGTSTTHEAVSTLADDYIISVATQYGFAEFNKKYPGKVIHVRFNVDYLIKFISEKGITEIIDTTHPHAREITETALKAANNAGIKYTDRIRAVKRAEGVQTFTDYDTLVSFMRERNYKSILITTGSNNIDKFTEFAGQAYARVLPFEKSIKACTDAGFHYSRIIAMQGPFSAGFNKALIAELKADCMITKNSGAGSGFDEKVQACADCGIDILVIEPPE